MLDAKKQHELAFDYAELGKVRALLYLMAGAADLGGAYELMGLRLKARLASCGKLLSEC
jgi:hypothetical protein